MRLPPILSSPSSIALLSILLVSTTSALPPAQLPLAMPPASSSSSNPITNPNPNSISESNSQGQSVSLADVLGTHRSLTTFFSLARQSAPLSALLAASSDPDLNLSPGAIDSNSNSNSNENSTGSTSTNTPATITVLAPLNSAIQHMPHKPWENPSDYSSRGASAYAGPDGRARADNNVRHFVEAHIIIPPHHAASAHPSGDAQPVWAEGARAETLAGRTLWWEMRPGRDGDGDGGRRVVMPDGVEVERVASRVSNGELWILKGVLSYQDAA